MLLAYLGSKDYSSYSCSSEAMGKSLATAHNPEVIQLFGTLPHKEVVGIVISAIVCIELIKSENAAPVMTQSVNKAQNDSKKSQFSEDFRAGLRYIAGWCIASLRRRKHRFISNNLLKS